jgi:hypothetical protein
VTKPARPHGTIPAAFSATGEDVPPSPDVEEHSLAQVIGEAVALHLAPLIARMRPARPGCITCAAKVKVAERNAKAAAEPLPDMGVTESFTHGRRGPVCWGCFDPDED